MHIGSRDLQRERVSIARALALQSEVLLFDEPTSALDPETIFEEPTVDRTRDFLGHLGWT